MRDTLHERKRVWDAWGTSLRLVRSPGASDDEKEENVISVTRFRLDEEDFSSLSTESLSGQRVPNLCQGSGQRVGHRGHMRIRTKRSA